MRTHHYPSDVSDEQWALIEPFIPVYPGGRLDVRDVVDAILSILRTGCQWRYLPANFPPRSTVWRSFDRWKADGTIDLIHDALRRKVRAQEKPYQPRTTASVDSQSVDATSGGEQRGRDNAKNVDGRKRHIVVDSMGLLLAVLVTAANLDDGPPARHVLARLTAEPCPRLEAVRGDAKDRNHSLDDWLADERKIGGSVVEVVERPAGSVGFVHVAKRWVVERTFAWIGRSRRNSRDYERLESSSEAMIMVGSIHRMLRSLKPDLRHPPAPFKYRENQELVTG